MFRFRVSPSVLFVGAAVVLAAGVGVIAKSAASQDPSSNALPTDAARLGFVQEGAAVNGVRLLDATKPFNLELVHGAVHGVPPRAVEGQKARAILTRELARYPQGFFEKVRMKGIVLTDDLHEGESPIPSLPNVAGLLLFDIAGSEADLTRGLHHEIFHFADVAHDGTMGSDPAWEQLNDPAFVYGGGGRTLRAAWAARPLAEDGFINGGFVSSYATSGVEEDKAETFAFAVAKSAQVKETAAHDPIMAAKLKEVVVRIAKLDPAAPQALALTTF